MSINKSQTILDVGQRLTQTRGYNAFSYADIAEQVRIRKASIHYYYPNKADLGRKLVMRYRRVMRQRLQAIEAQSTYPVEPLRGLVTIFREALQEDSLCLGSMLSAEYITLPGTVQTEVQGYFADMETWVAQVIQSGQESGYWRCIIER
jgi:TetR/AcrR family transcriptional repressor of nem operon